MNKFYTFSVIAILIIAAVLGLSIVRQSRSESERKMLKQLNAVGEFYEKYIEDLKAGRVPYDPEIYALDANRGELREEYFGIRLADLEKDSEGNYIMNDAQRDTLIENLAGRHMCSLQWISWHDFGSVTFTPDGDGGLICKGGQKSKENDDYLEFDGRIVPISPILLEFTGKIVTKVHHNNNGKPLVRNGKYMFYVAGSRSYWRMAENCTSDYIDIYFD